MTQQEFETRLAELLTLDDKAPDRAAQAAGLRCEAKALGEPKSILDLLELLALPGQESDLVRAAVTPEDSAQFVGRVAERLDLQSVDNAPRRRFGLGWAAAVLLPVLTAGLWWLGAFDRVASALPEQIEIATSFVDGPESAPRELEPELDKPMDATELEISSLGSVADLELAWAPEDEELDENFGGSPFATEDDTTDWLPPTDRLTEAQQLELLRWLQEEYASEEGIS